MNTNYTNYRNTQNNKDNMGNCKPDKWHKDHGVNTVHTHIELDQHHFYWVFNIFYEIVNMINDYKRLNKITTVKLYERVFYAKLKLCFVYLILFPISVLYTVLILAQMD